VYPRAVGQPGVGVRHGVVEPATAQVMATIESAGIEETDAAVERARRAYPGWRTIAPADRAALLHRLADAIDARRELLAKLEARNAGKPIGDARGEMQMVVDTFDYYAAAPERTLATRSRWPAAWR